MDNFPRIARVCVAGVRIARACVMRAIPSRAYGATPFFFARATPFFFARGATPFFFAQIARRFTGAPGDFSRNFLCRNLIREGHHRARARAGRRAIDPVDNPVDNFFTLWITLFLRARGRVLIARAGRRAIRGRL